MHSYLRTSFFFRFMHFRVLFSVLFPLVLSFSALSQENGLGACGNGLDDDGDGLIDCYDPDCAGDLNCDGYFFGQVGSCSFPPGAPFAMRPEWKADSLCVFSTQTPVAGDI